MKNKAILIIGDRKVNRIKINPSLVKFVKYARRLKAKRGLEVEEINYKRLLYPCGHKSGECPSIKASKILVVFFFPYTYWNRNIETYQDGRIYGDKKFGRAFRAFFKEVKRTIEKHYRDKKIEYLNAPQASYLDRDKQTSKALLRERNVPTPRTFSIKSFAEIEKLLNRGVKLYIKPRFGALGKGITYIDKEGMISNFLFRKGRVISRPYDYDWRFAKIKHEDRCRFFNALLECGVICEQAIEPALFKDKRFDFRIYVMFGRVVYLYAKSSPAASWVTNWSQGGEIDRKDKILRTLPKEKILLLKRLSRKAAAALGLNFAGIDIIFSKDFKDAYVLEGNAFPGYEKGFDLMKCLLKFVVR